MSNGRDRRRRREHRFHGDESLVCAAEDVRPIGTVDESALVAAAVDTLDPLLREAFVLKHVEDLEYSEIAAITGASISALKMRVKRACDALRPMLETIYHD
jgi:RNA polymerase sigma-70 factor (ECF subfamily)